ncbi:hypothetical protein AYR62_15445 [Secundilactobacillus paracollinoides]|uniref:nicotinate-nucleotide diphosphorylase (carboxylating) n=1 Tax=Secundilactobacillus paracollinoides TaxID=240427 RepID=A0A1B2IVY5_9LACO|nr:carboxylating nicotinate-nucleotide diphosphorylase [Secundilactobacillus paracollinoides]ANZ60386.1 hypothetical protein AYR61_02830 [Secundilactobacillus paracollinoides]ANZ65333.1 hypothetical protein AYR62_15445 [Secundilactobacillus paracollinoides]ANZ66215.1 hypothetical protein AYR63_03035 [Secundilactobacillus paracollinoides]KRL75033.1 nicotinate-nucleotide pyrophosphorylase [Secundilactobacillus paracollinoides DSM 15502 = JCM 11969]
MPLNVNAVLPLLRGFIREDLGTGDLTASLLEGRPATGRYNLKTAGTVAGQQLPGLLYHLLGDDAAYTPEVQDGETVAAGTVLGTATGNMATILAAERLSLNLMQRMSGIATTTRTAVQTLADDHTQILDTRKTAPGLRVFDKYAVRCGGGLNHRMGLYDLAMLKDNHWHAVGSLTAAVQQLRTVLGPAKKIEVEVETDTELQAAIDAQVDIIMFDNQRPDVVRAWQPRVPAEIQTEISGGITLETLPDYAGTGADFLSLGFLTNRVVNLDIGFDLD